MMFGKKKEAPVQIVDAKEVSLNQSAVRSVRADEVSMQMSAAQGITADKVMSSGGAVAFVKAGEANIEQGITGMIVGDWVKAVDASAVFLVARNVEGSIKPIFDQKSALAFGAGLAATFVVLSLVKALISSRD